MIEAPNCDVSSTTLTAREPIIVYCQVHRQSLGRAKKAVFHFQLELSRVDAARG